jgi:hypothetical protein
MPRENGMPRPHDRGGWPTAESIDRSDHELMDWEQRVDALHQVLGRKGIRSTDEMRRAIESLGPDTYEALTYYERWTAALEILVVEKGILTADEIDRKMSELKSESP